MEDKTVLFRNATVVDGTGSVPFRADVLVKGTSVEAVLAPHSTVSCTDTIDASGLILCPGFMDIHAHSDLEVL
ncbi:MAG: D-aminoacylase, partial [Spirochaetales bacterium]|nr:D-aminoacylase [Spirochaetales bacterium]